MGIETTVAIGASGARNAVGVEVQSEAGWGAPACRAAVLPDDGRIILDVKGDVDCVTGQVAGERLGAGGDQRQVAGAEGRGSAARPGAGRLRPAEGVARRIPVVGAPG